MNVTLTGPNAHGGMFHVHKAGCRDLDRGVYRRSRSMDERYDETHASAQSVAEGIYADQIAEDDELTWERCLGEIKFFPCTKTLPYADSEVVA